MELTLFLKSETSKDFSNHAYTCSTQVLETMTSKYTKRSTVTGLQSLDNATQSQLLSLSTSWCSTWSLLFFQIPTRCSTPNHLVSSFPKFFNQETKWDSTRTTAHSCLQWLHWTALCCHLFLMVWLKSLLQKWTSLSWCSSTQCLLWSAISSSWLEVFSWFRLLISSAWPLRFKRSIRHRLWSKSLLS